MASPFDNLSPEFSARIKGLLAESGGRISVVSGYRTRARQEELWQRALKKYGGNVQQARSMVAVPGSSSHEHGEAFDLGGDLALAHALGPKYGLHFPMDGKNGKGLEPWHVEREDWNPRGGAHTTAPVASDYAADITAGLGQGAAEPTGDHIDRLFQGLSSAIGEQSGDALGEFTAGSVGDYTANVGSGQTGSTPEEVGSSLGAPMSGATAPTQEGAAAPVGGGEDIDRFMSAISGQESGGNYNATNARTGASGRFQIMPGNWPAWSREAGLPANAPRTAENQDKVARFKMQQYYQQFGDWRKVAMAWYGGPGSVNYSDAAKSRKQGAGNEPSLNEYANSIMRRMGG